ncbi:MAG: nucleotide exchange factor GrpE [Planctomycetes bacterium]|nr:nucleotide exchange factor GrpE [Planctomycetota bacterium]
MNEEAIESILADFRAWLLEAPDVPSLEPVESLEVATVIQHFIALRQEVNLQTKAARAQQEQSSQAAMQLQQALDVIQRREQQARDCERNAQDELVRPLLKALIDAHDGLWLAEREVVRMLDNPPDLRAGVQPLPPSPHAPPIIKLRLPHWTRWMGLDASVETQLAPLFAWYASHGGAPIAPAPETDESADRLKEILEALLVGYRMSLQRLQRAMDQQGLETVACVGEPFDPETMEVAEVVREEGRESTEVLDEIRRGYLWRGRLFRYAQVRVISG